jgi:hypothetical protein
VFIEVWYHESGLPGEEPEKIHDLPKVAMETILSCSETLG